MSSIAVRRFPKVLAAAVLPVFLLVAVAVALPGCGEGEEPGPGDSGDTGSVTDPGQSTNGSPDNVAACNAWLEANQCGTYDFSQAVNCQTYAATPCDVSAYFDCLTDNTTCMDLGGMSIPDTSGWTACTALAQCQ